MVNFFKRGWPILILVTIWAIFFYPVWLQNKTPMPADLIVGGYYPWYDYKWGDFSVHVPVKNPLLSDVPALIYPLRFIAIEMLKKGELPLWNPYMLNGYPLFGEFQSAILNPANLVYLFLDFVDGWTLEVCLQIILAMIFMYIYLRSFKLHKISALFGSIAYGLCGFNIFWMEYNIHTFVAALIPLFLLLVDKYIASSKVIYLVFLSITMAIQIFMGFPQITIYTLALLLLYGGFRLRWQKVSSQNLKKFVGIVFFIFWGILLAGIQLLPGLELYSNSQRLVEKVDLEYRFLKPEQLVHFIVPDYFGSSATYNWWGSGDYTSALGYTGVIAFILCFASVFKIKQREVLFFWFLGIITISLIVYNPISEFLNDYIIDVILKGFQAAFITKALIFANLSIAVLGAFGMESFLFSNNVRRILYFLSVPLMFVIALFIGTAFSLLFLKLNLQALNHLPSSVDILNGFIKNYTISIRNTAVSVTFLLPLIFIIFIRYKFKNARLWSGVLVCLLLSAELVRYGWKITPFAEKSFVFPTTPVIDFLKSQDQPFRILSGDVITENMWVPYGLSSPDGYESIYPVRTAQLISSINDNKVEAVPLGKFAKLRNYDSDLTDLMNGAFLLSLKVDKKGVSEEGSYKKGYISDKFKLIFEEKSVAVLQNTKVLPRAFVVTQWEILDNEKEVLDRLINDGFPKDEKIILEEPFNLFMQSDQNISKVEYLTLGSNGQKINVSTQNPGFLFISDTWYPGWKAFVDGKPTPIFMANYNFRAIPVTEGEHEVDIRYEPESFKKGAWVSLATLLILLAISIYSLRNGNKLLKT